MGGLHHGAGGGGGMSSPDTGGIVDAPAGKKASPIQDQLDKLGLDPNKKGFQDKFKMQKSGLNFKANPDYEGFTDGA